MKSILSLLYHLTVNGPSEHRQDVAEKPQEVDDITQRLNKTYQDGPTNFVYAPGSTSSSG